MRHLPFAILTSAILSVSSAATAQEDPPRAARTTPSLEPLPYSLRAGIEIGARWFVYSDPLRIATNLRPYDIVGVPLFAFGGDVRPFAWTDVRVLRRVEIGFDYAFAPSLDSFTSSGDEVQTSWDHGDIALRVPFRIGKRQRLAPKIGYGWIEFSFPNAGSLAPEIPSVDYRFVRLGLSGETKITRRLTLLASFDYLAMISEGQVYDRFRDTKIGGIDASLGLGINIAKRTRISISADYTRFYSSFEPVPGDAYVAGGALDEFASLKIGFEYGR